MKQLWSIVCEKNPNKTKRYFYAIMPNGIKLPLQTEIKIHETVTSMECEVKFLINIKNYVIFDGRNLKLNNEILPKEWFKELHVFAALNKDSQDYAIIKIEAEFDKFVT